MMRGELIAGFEGLHRFGATKNYHVADKDGRAYFCGCFKSIWTTTTSGKQKRKNPSSMKLLKNSKAVRLEPWYREYIFHRNLERQVERRTIQEYLNSDVTWSAVGTISGLDKICKQLEVRDEVSD